MVCASDSLSAGIFLNIEFPPDRALPPAALTIPLSYLYGAGAALHRTVRRLSRPCRVRVPVISVGNIMAGGTGKTPCVIALVQRLAMGNKVAVLSRGYGRTDSSLVEVTPDMDYRRCGDEPLLIKRACPEAAVVVHACRAEAARHATEKLGVRLLILDDGFQHLPLARDLDLVVLDGANPFGNGRLLPAGPLRERPSALGRADAIIAVGEEVSAAERTAAGLQKPFIHFRSELVLPSELSTDLSTPVWLLTSIARPQRLVNDLNNKKINIVGRTHFPDHHHFANRDLVAVAERAEMSGARLVVTTAKDRVRLSNWPSALPLCVFGLHLELLTPKNLDRLLEPLLAQAVV